MLCFSTTLLLSATCLLVNAEIVTTCEGNVQRLSCDTGVISVQTVLYGRANRVVCKEGKHPDEFSHINCSLLGAVDVVRKRCDGKKVCELSTHVFTAPDPCRGTFKYLQTKYTCLPATHLVTCEHSLALLQCNKGQVIFVYGADYGRRDQSTCSYALSPTQIQNTQCSCPTSKVADSCNGQNCCIVKASNSVFGDPCVGTYKYLEVAYTCKYPDANEEFL